MESLIFLLMIVVAVLAIEERSLINSILYLEALSLFAVFSYTLLNAPDIALAEVVIGSLFSTLLLLIGLREKRIFRIGYFRTEDINALDVEHNFFNFASEYELQLDVVERDNDISLIKDRRECDIILRVINGEYLIYLTDKVLKKDELLSWVESKKFKHPSFIKEETNENI